MHVGALSPMATYLVETVVTLLAVTALAVLVLYAARRAGVGRQSGPLQLVGRLPLDGRRAVYLVRVADKVIVVGASEAGLTRLGEVEGEFLEAEEKPQTSFSDVVGRMMRAPPRKNIRVENLRRDRGVPSETHGETAQAEAPTRELVEPPEDDK